MRGDRRGVRAAGPARGRLQRARGQPRRPFLDHRPARCDAVPGRLRPGPLPGRPDLRRGLRRRLQHLPRLQGGRARMARPRPGLAAVGAGLRLGEGRARPAPHQARHPHHPRTGVRGRRVVVLRAATVGQAGQGPRPDLPHPQRPLLARRPSRPQERRRERRPPASDELPEPLLRRRGDDPSLPLRPGPEHDRRRDAVAVDPRPGGEGAQRARTAGDGAVRCRGPLLRRRRLRRAVRRVRAGARAPVPARVPDAGARDARVLAVRRARGGRTGRGHGPRPVRERQRPDGGQGRRRPADLVHRPPPRPTGPRQPVLPRWQAPADGRLPPHGRRRSPQLHDLQVRLHHRGVLLAARRLDRGAQRVGRTGQSYRHRRGGREDRGRPRRAARHPLALRRTRPAVGCPPAQPAGHRHQLG